MRKFKGKNLFAGGALSAALMISSGCEVVEDITREILVQSATSAGEGASAGSGGSSGETRAIPGGGPGIALSDAAGKAGQTVKISATLSTGSASIAGAQNDLQFDPSVMSVAEGRKGKPDCQVNPAINKSASAFAFTPSRCSGKSCTGVRALILSLTDVEPIANGSRLYTCSVAIAATVKPGSHTLGNAKVSLSTPAGDAVKAKGVSSTITVQ